jgi:hypothetical protein
MISLDSIFDSFVGVPVDGSMASMGGGVDGTDNMGVRPQE